MAEVSGGSSGGVSSAEVASQISSAIASKADTASVPLPSTAMPPGVADNGTVGSDLRYALANHTHASKVRKARVTGISTATYAWTYSTPFTTGVIPIIQAIVEDPANSALDSYNVQVASTPSATGCTLRIIRQTSGLFGLLTGAIGFNPTPSNITLHLTALEP